MRKAIIIYSKSGNTRAVANRINVIYQGDLLEVKAENDDPNILDPILTETPDVTPYDQIIFASPVHGFMLPKVMLKYLNQAGDLFGKQIDLFVTHYFPFQWMGGTQTLKQMKKIVEIKHGEVHQMTSVNWKSKKREIVIENMIHQLSVK
jgi:menaquinone-dependent protoporphyrinogen IX oxidase